jgi:glycerol uptake facilitator-like aquaporin
MLSFFLQKICNSQTTFTTSDIETYCFTVVFVYLGRRFAVTSGNSINPVATLAAACAALIQCTFGPVQYFYLFFIGDLLGSMAGSFFYNCVYEPALRISRQ